MDADLFRPILSGIIGSVVAALLCKALTSKFPSGYSRQAADTLIKENRLSIWMANAAFFGGIISAVAIYNFNIFSSNDWRGFALGAGGGCVAALLILPIQALITHRSVNEAYFAYSISQNTPRLFLYGILIIGVGFFPPH